MKKLLLLFVLLSTNVYAEDLYTKSLNEYENLPKTEDEAKQIEKEEKEQEKLLRKDCFKEIEVMRKVYNSRANNINKETIISVLKLQYKTTLKEEDIIKAYDQTIAYMNEEHGIRNSTSFYSNLIKECNKLPTK